MRLYKIKLYRLGYCVVIVLRKESFKWFGNYDYFFFKWNRLSFV